MSNYNLNVGWGRHWLESFPSLGGKIFFVMQSTNVNYDMVADIVQADPEGNLRLFTTPLAAYAAMTTNSNDVMYLFDSIAHTTAFDWAKNKCHLVGVGNPGGVFMSAAISTSTITLVETLKVSGNYNYFKNVRIDQYAATGVASLYDLHITGTFNVFENCVMDMCGVGNTLAGGGTIYFGAGGSYNRFINCQIGQGYTAHTEANGLIRFGDGNAKHNEFVDCILKTQATVDTHRIVKIDVALAGPLIFNGGLWLAYTYKGGGAGPTVGIANAIGGATSAAQMIVLNDVNVDYLTGDVADSTLKATVYTNVVKATANQENNVMVTPTT
jgi:hypothetical protein